MNKSDTIFYIFIIALLIFICGVQVGIRHGKELQRQDYYDYIIQN